MDYGKLAYQKAEELEKIIFSDKNNTSSCECFEVKNAQMNKTITSLSEITLASISADNSAKPCFFINLDFSASQSATIDLTLYFNSSVVATLTKTISQDNGAIYLQSIASVASGLKGELKLKIETNQSVVLNGVDLIALNATTEDIPVQELEVKATALNTDLAISFIKENTIYYAICSTDSPELNPQNFISFKSAISHDITFDSKKQNNPLTFAYIDSSHDLYLSTLGINGDVFIDSDVSSAILQNSDDEDEDMVIVYVQNGEVFYKVISGGVLGQKNKIALPSANFCYVRKFFSEKSTIYIVATDENNNNYVCNSLVPISAKNLKEHLYCTMALSVFSLEDVVSQYNSVISSLNVDLVYSVIANSIIPHREISMTDVSNIQLGLDMELAGYTVGNDVVCYGVSFDMHGTNYNNGITGAVYTGDCASFTPASITITGGVPSFNGGSWENIWPYNQIKPCLKNGNSVIYLNPTNLTQSADGTQTNLDITSGNSGDVFVEIPKIYYRFYKTDADVLQFEISNYHKPRFCDYAYIYQGQTANKLYFGAYPTSIVGNVARSLSGQAKYRTNNVDMGPQQTYINNRGTGFSMVNLNNSLLVQLLFILQFKSIDYKNSIGYGFTAANEKNLVYTGYSNDYPSRTYGYKTTASAKIDRFLNIEGFASFANYTIEGSFVTPSQLAIMKVDSLSNNWVSNSKTGYMFQKIVWPTLARRGKKFICNNYFGLMTIECESASTSGGFDFFKVRTTSASANSYNLHYPSAGNNLIGVFSYLCMHVGLSNYGYGHRIVYYDL